MIDLVHNGVNDNLTKKSHRGINCLSISNNVKLLFAKILCKIYGLSILLYTQAKVNSLIPD